MSRPSSGTSAKAEHARRLVVSFHDLHPGSRETCHRFLRRLAGLGVERTTLLVVPRWHGGPPIHLDAACVEWLHEAAAAGHEVCLHGYFHRADRIQGGPMQQLIGRRYTAGEGEFYQIDLATALHRIQLGLSMLRDEAGLPVVGFTPPAWLMSAGGREAARRCGLHYSTTFGAVERLQTGEIIAAPTLVYSCRNVWRRFVSRGWVRFWGRLQRAAPLLRIAAHPGDFADARVEASLYARVAQAISDGRRPVTYCEVQGETEAAAGADPATTR